MTNFFRDSEAIGGSYFKYRMSWIFASGRCCYSGLFGAGAVPRRRCCRGRGAVARGCEVSMAVWGVGTLMEIRFPQCQEGRMFGCCPIFFWLSGVYAGICFCPRRVLLFYLFGCDRYSDIQKIRIYIHYQLLAVIFLAWYYLIWKCPEIFQLLVFRES